MMIFFLCLIKKGFRDDKDLESPPILSIKGKALGKGRKNIIRLTPHDFESFEK